MPSTQQTFNVEQPDCGGVMEFSLIVYINGHNIVFTSIFVYNSMHAYIHPYLNTQTHHMGSSTWISKFAHSIIIYVYIQIL